MKFHDLLYVCTAASALCMSAYNMQSYKNLSGKPTFCGGLMETITHDSVIVDSTKYMNMPSGNLTQYIRGNGTLATFPSIPAQYNPVQGNNITISGSYPNQTFAAAADSVQFFNRTGRLKRVIKIFTDTFTVTRSDSFYADFSAAGFTSLMGAPQVTAIKNTGVATNVPDGCLRSFSTSGAVINMIEGSNNLVTLLSVSVLSGASTNFASTSGLKISITAMGY